MSRLRRAALEFIRFLIWSYPFSLFCVYWVIRSTAESFWVTALCAYLPPQGYLIPGPILFFLALIVGPVRLALVPLAGMLFVVSFMMGFHFSFKSDESPELTVVTMNVDSAHRGVDEIVRGILSNQPDIVFLQEIGFRGDLLAEALRRTLPHAVVWYQFVIASRYPLSEPTFPEAEHVRGRMRSPQFIALVAQTPGGPVQLYNAHPVSPRHAFGAVRGEGFRKEIRSGRLFRGEAADYVHKNVEIRRFELEALAESAKRASLPTIVAGDLNLTQMSPLFDEVFGDFADSFADAGRGFGFTYPSKILFLRLDRVLAIHGPRFLDSEVGCKGLSDHICVVAKIEISPR